MEMRECKTHGLTEYRPTTNGAKRITYRCAKCNTDAVKKRRRNLKVLAVEYKGGKCQNCGYSKCMQALDFHHIDSSQKDFGIAAKGMTRSWEKVKLELDKCILVCRNCHAEIHEKQGLEA